MRFNSKNQKTTSFKKRYYIGYKTTKLIFGNFSITLNKSYNLEYIYLYNFKKSLKKRFSFKKSKRKKIWLFIHKNYPLTKKSKNARMGKGKGALSRYCARILQNHNLFEFTGFTLRELLRLKRVFQKKLRIPAKINSNFFINKQYICPFGNENLYFFRKYEH